jgi:hypothetical protein
MPASLPKGIVFVSYSHADKVRVGLLVDQLKTRFNVFWDDQLEPGNVWRHALADKLNQARCVLALWTKHLDESSFVTSEVERASRRGVLLPVKLDPDAYVPLGFDRWQHLDLSGWPGQGTRGLAPLFERIRRLLAQPVPRPWSNALPESASWVITQSSNAVGDIRDLVNEVRTLGGVLVREDGPVGDVTATLNEIHATYAAALEAINRFLEPGARRSLLKSYLRFSGGELIRLVDDKRGHCSRILEFYGRAGGLREWLRERATPKLLEDADNAFVHLGTADGDLFGNLTRIGEVLSDEATDIANLLIGGQNQMAAERITIAKRTLLPLRRKLSSAMSELQRIEASMGFVPAKR